MTHTPDAATHDEKQIACFAKSTWTALGLAALCFGVDAYVMIYIPLSRSAAERALSHPAVGLVLGLRTVEATLALLAGGLLYYAFSRPPRLPRSA